MTISPLTLLLGAMWTIGAFGAGQLFRLVSNVVLTRLLAPELFGVVVLIYSLRTGVDLFFDAGLRQSVVQNPHADEPDFYNTAWTLQLVRGGLLFCVAAVMAAPLARLYDLPILAAALPVAAFYFVLMGLVSIGDSLAQRRMQFKRLNSLDVAQEAFSAFAHIVLALITPTIWALVLGGLFSAAARTIGSYFLIGGLRQRILICRNYAWQIMDFGKWILLSSLVYFLSMNLDRLYLGKLVALEFLGIYGIAKSLSDLLTVGIIRLSNVIIFPLVASSAQRDRGEVRKELAAIHLALVLSLALGFSIFIAGADYVIAVLYDSRYQEARWILPLLATGGWFSVLATINESMLMGLGKPVYGIIGQGLKVTWLFTFLPVGFLQMGVFGAVAVVAVSDIWRYLPAFVGQRKERLSFFSHDQIATLAMVVLVVGWETLRWSMGLGTSFATFPSTWF